MTSVTSFSKLWPRGTISYQWFSILCRLLVTSQHITFAWKPWKLWNFWTRKFWFDLTCNVISCTETMKFNHIVVSLRDYRMPFQFESQPSSLENSRERFPLLPLGRAVPTDSTTGRRLSYHADRYVPAHIPKMLWTGNWSYREDFTIIYYREVFTIINVVAERLSWQSRYQNILEGMQVCRCNAKMPCNMRPSTAHTFHQMSIRDFSSHWHVQWATLLYTCGCVVCSSDNTKKRLA